ncbi:hypothetical protein FA15DRAFT_684529 [Coprinopsis marcescibilis]|uniref:Uncharacterized protein n=1 Tax=Coprinopsis marcescibilis TaxID=230819 RepID=A0A5C3LCF3_COPMA|nr:hypothetical protein FA15DRAFT_684529 [Coprinopsis marcescibilis]
MANIGSAFLGDRQRIRHLSSSTTHSRSPPSSPPPTGISGMMQHSATSPLAASFDDVDDEASASSRKQQRQHVFVVPHEQQTRPKPIDPRLALELRVRWLEAIVYGAKHEAGAALQGQRTRPAPPAKGKQRDPSVKDGETLIRLAENVQSRLSATVESNEGLRKFMDHYDQHAQYLSPAFALTGIIADEEAPSSSYSGMTAEEIDAFLTEMEPDIRAADRDMSEIEALVKKGVTGAGRLPDHENLKPRLDALIARNRSDLELAASLERRIATIMQRHATSVDALSELFVAWDDALTVAEDGITKMEKEKQDRRRIGLE